MNSLTLTRDRHRAARDQQIAADETESAIRLAHSTAGIPARTA